MAKTKLQVKWKTRISFPEILITDIVMQDLSGIDLMEYVNHAPFHTKVVVISGYNNFEYVRGSLQNGGIDYLLKPLEQNQLIAAVKKAVCSWIEEESLRSAVQSHADKIHSMTAMCKENLLSKLLAGEQPEQTYRELIQLCPELGSQPSYGFACCLLKPFAPNQDELSDFRDMLEAFGEDTKAGFLLPSGHSQEILFFLSNPASEILNQLEQHLTAWNAQFSFPVSMGLSLSGSFPNNLKETLAQLSNPASEILNQLEQHLTAWNAQFSFPVSMGLSLSGSFPNNLKETLAQSKKAYGCLDSVSLTPVLCRIDGFSSNSLEHHPLLPSSEEKDRFHGTFSIRNVSE